MMRTRKTIRIAKYVAAGCMMAVVLTAGSLVGRIRAEASSAKGNAAKAAVKLSAEESVTADSLLQVTHKEVYVLDGFSFTDLLNDKSASYQVLPESQNANAVEISKEGFLTAKEEGMAEILVSNKKKEEVFTVTVMKPEKLYAGYGETVELSVWNWYDPSMYECIFAGNSLKAGEKNGSYVITGFQDTEIYLHKKGTEERLKVAEVILDLPEFSFEYQTRALGTESFTPSMEHFSLESLKEGEKVAFWVEDIEKAMVEGLEVTVVGEGATKLWAEVTAQNGEKYVFCTNLVITNPEISVQNDTITQGEEKAVPVTGIDKEHSIITYEIANETILSISEKGELRGLVPGETTVDVFVDGKKFPMLYVVEENKEIGEAVAKAAIAIANSDTKYSQAKRMEEGFYDCSSLVARIYQNYQINFGAESSWAPTAADIGKWCVENDKVLAKKGLAAKKLKKGDLIFFSHKSNGRYLNITHVEIYVGSGKCVSASANKNKVIQYDYNTSNVVLIARPAK